MIQQFTYTASPWGKSGAGWQVFQQSHGVTSDVVKKLYEVYQYEAPKRILGDEARPVQFVYFPEHSGQDAVLAQTTFTGKRWFGDPRAGDFLAHVLLLDNGAVEKSAAEGRNPVRLYKSAGLQAMFPEQLKEKAFRISRKETAWEPPPELPELQSLSDLPENPQLAFDAALDAIPEHAARQLGALVRAIVRRTTGNSDNPIVFDSGNKFSPFVMTLALDLIPPAWRAQTWFAVHFTESALRRLPNFSSLTFYGTDGTASSDPDSGIASGVDFAEDPFNFIDRNDVRAFKKQLDLIGADVSLDDYKGLIGCRRITSGKATDLASLRSAMSFADKFTGLKDEIGAGLARSLATYTHSAAINIPADFHVLSAVAWFECGLKAFEDHAKRACSICTQSLATFAKVASELQGNATACANFVNAVVDVAKTTDPAAFVNRVVESASSFEMFVSRRSEADLFCLAVEYKKVLNNLDDCRVIEKFPIDAGSALRKVKLLLSMVGSGVKDIDESKKYLEYRLDLANVRQHDDVLPAMMKYVTTGFPKWADPRKDIIARFRKPQASIRELVELGFILNALKLQGVDFICEGWDSECKRYQKEIEDLTKKGIEDEKKESEEPERFGSLILLIVCAIGIAVGVFVGRKYFGAKVDKAPYGDYLQQRGYVAPNDNQDTVGESNEGKGMDVPTQPANKRHKRWR